MLLIFIHLSILVLSVVFGVLLTLILIDFFDLPKFLIRFGNIDDTNVIYKLMLRLTSFAAGISILVFLINEISILV